MKSGLPCLVDLVLRDCPELESFPDGGLPSKLKSLKINSCKKLMERRKEWNLQALLSLSSLEYEWYSFDETESFPGEGMLLPPTHHSSDWIALWFEKPRLQGTSTPHKSENTCDLVFPQPREAGNRRRRRGGTTASISYHSSIMGYPKSQVIKPIQVLTSLTRLSIKGCNKISEEVTLPSTITFLKLVLTKMKSLDGWGCLTSLEELRICLCDYIESITTREEPLPSSLRLINLKSCGRLKSIQRGETIPSSHQSLHIIGCPLLEEKYQSELSRWPRRAGFGSSKKSVKVGTVTLKSVVGLGFKTPREAVEGTYIDKKCPFTGNVSIRVRILAGTCHSAKMMRTIIVRRNYLHFIKKYQRYEKRHSNILAHVAPCFRVKEGDHVIIGQCRPLSKTVRFNVVKVIPAGSSAGGKKAFTGM